MRNDFKSNYLMHHGILGQKWGVRRYQNPDGSLTSVGKERYGKNEKEKTNKLTEDQKKAIRNAAIATAAVATIAVGAYYANKYRNMHMDKIIKSGTQIQHMSKKCNELLNQPFYASYLKADNKAYAANDFFGSKWSHKMVMNAQKDLKIAGKKTAEKAYSEWLNANPKAKARFGNASYFSFNRNLGSPDIYDKEHFASFYKYLESKGYDAVHDWNDQFQSGRIAPLIIFGSLGEIKISDITKLKP